MDFPGVPLCLISSDVVSGHFWHWDHAYLNTRVVLVLERPCLGLMTPSSSLSMLGPMVPEFLITSILPFWPVVLWPGKCLGGSSGGTSPGPAALFPAAGAPLSSPACWEHCFPPHWADFWHHSEPLVPFGGKDFSTLPMGMPTGARSSRNSRSFCLKSGLWGRHCWFRGAWCPTFPSFLTAPPAGLLSPIWATLFVVVGMWLAIHCLKLFFPASTFQPSLPTSSPPWLWSFSVPKPWSKGRD